MTSHAIKTTKADKPVTILTHAYKVERAYPHFYMSVYTLYSDGTYKQTSETDKESLPMLLNRLEKLTLKGLGKL